MIMNIIGTVLGTGILFLLANLVILVILIELNKSDDVVNGYDYFTPSKLYKTTKMNKFGCVVVSIFLFAINYLYCTVVLVYKLFHVGRKD